ncbi:hypothetical protein FF2_034532 [Malus domestica]
MFETFLVKWTNGQLHTSDARQHLPGKCFSISSVKFYVVEALLALEYLHIMGIVYRDLKPENVLVREDGHIMILDFDLSLKCDVFPKLLRRKSKLESDQKSAKSSSMSCCAVAPMQPVLSCFSSSHEKKKKKRPRRKISFLTNIII